MSEKSDILGYGTIGTVLLINFCLSIWIPRIFHELSKWLPNSSKNWAQKWCPKHENVVSYLAPQNMVPTRRVFVFRGLKMRRCNYGDLAVLTAPPCVGSVLHCAEDTRERISGG